MAVKRTPSSFGLETRESACIPSNGKVPDGLSKRWRKERAANLRMPVVVKVDPEFSDILSCRMTLHLMGSNAGVYVWISMGHVKRLWGMPAKAISTLARDLYVLG